jgi:peptide/nickel transport system substrate-binding protein
VIDDWTWFVSGTDANELYINSELPWPNSLAYTVYQSLVTVNETAQFSTGNIQYLPGLATGWNVSSNGTVYTFNLRQNVTFSDGNPFNAYQAWMEYYGLYYLTDNSSTWMESYPLFNMNSSNFGPSTIALINQSGLVNPSQQALSIMENSSWPIYVTGPYTLVFHLAEPFIYFPGVLVVYDGLMFDTQWLLDHGGFGTPTTYNSYFNLNPIPGTGPYVVTQVSEENYVSFTQNPTYWGDSLTPAQLAFQPIWDPGHAKNVIVYNKPDDLSRYTDLSTGAAQIATIQTQDFNLITSNPQYSYFVNPPWNGEVALMGLNVNEYPTNITDFRQAIVHAINYTDLYASGYDQNMTPYVGPEYPAWTQYYDLGGYKPYQFNLTLAQQYLNESGVNVANLPPLTFRTVSDCAVCSSAAQIIQADLAQIGINVNIEVLSSGQYYAGTYGTFQQNVQNAAAIGQISFVNGGFGWGPATLTPADYWVTFVSNTSVWGNWAGYSNPIVQQCVNAFTSTTNVTLIQSLCTAAQAQIYQDAPYAWIGTFGLWGVAGGSLAWKTSVIKSFYVDPVWTGQTTDPIFNTVIFAS